jgi:hypothetical protein
MKNNRKIKNGTNFGANKPIKSHEIDFSIYKQSRFAHEENIEIEIDGYLRNHPDGQTKRGRLKYLNNELKRLSEELKEKKEILHDHAFGESFSPMIVLYDQVSGLSLMQETFQEAKRCYQGLFFGPDVHFFEPDQRYKAVFEKVQEFANSVEIETGTQIDLDLGNRMNMLFHIHFDYFQLFYEKVAVNNFIHQVRNEYYQVEKAENIKQWIPKHFEDFARTLISNHNIFVDNGITDGVRNQAYEKACFEFTDTSPGDFAKMIDRLREFDGKVAPNIICFSDHEIDKTRLNQLYEAIKRTQKEIYAQIKKAK